MPDKVFETGLTIEGDITKEMDRGVKGSKAKIKVIPRSNKAYLIVPLPPIPHNFNQQRDNGMPWGCEEHRRLGIIRDDI